MEKNERKAYVYARVNAGDFSVSGISCGWTLLDAQRDRLLACAEAMGFDAAERDAEFARLGVSETAWRKMLDASDSGRVQVVMIASCGRLHRDPMRAIALLEELDQRGVQIYSEQEGWINVASEEGAPTLLQLFQSLKALDERERGDLNAISG